MNIMIVFEKHYHEQLTKRQDRLNALNPRALSFPFHLGPVVQSKLSHCLSINLESVSSEILSGSIGVYFSEVLK